MANYGNSKIKLLKLLEILNRSTDEEHPLSGGEICALLQAEGVPCERKSVYRDIAVLCDYGIDVIATRTPRPGFFLARRRFELPEVRLLMDAVLTAPFITAKKTAELMGKLRALLSSHQADSLKKQIYMDERIKFDNEEIYYTIDAVSRAVAEKKKLGFVYHHKVIRGRRAEWDEGREFVISPYALLWANDKYYVAGNYEKYGTVSNYRLDRMRLAEVTDREARPFSQVSPYRRCFDAADYLKKTFNMYCGEQQRVELRCSNSILEAIADRFGAETEFFCHDENAFTVRANVYVSDGLIEWLLQYGSRITVLSPGSLRAEMIRRIREMDGAYRVSQKTDVP